jgi:hypothetical protein
VTFTFLISAKVYQPSLNELITALCLLRPGSHYKSEGVDQLLDIGCFLIAQVCNIIDANWQTLTTKRPESLLGNSFARQDKSKIAYRVEDLTQVRVHEPQMLFKYL